MVLQLKRSLLINKLKINTRRSHEMIAISEHTKHDFINFLGVPTNKITVVPLGVSAPEVSKEHPKLMQSISTSWGYTRRPFTLDPAVPFMLFIGGVDSRRKLEDVVAAFNNLRAQGTLIKLVLAGDIMLGPDAITTPHISDSLNKSSYLDDIVFMGFIDDDSKNWLYAHALAYIFPSRYEGFGLPVLEAMIRDCPVICYRSAAVDEIAGDAVLYADTMQDIVSRIMELLNYSEAEQKSLRKKGADVAKRYDWAQTSSNITKVLYNSK
jgi:glycosyltransferase involved in cell wall biosynthesis